jgi:hypothetical protein
VNRPGDEHEFRSVTGQGKPGKVVEQAGLHAGELLGLAGPPYHGPQSPLDLVAIGHMFGRLFEAF